MTIIEANTSPPVGMTAHTSDAQQTKDQHEYMRGWALASLTLAFMSICFVQALDNTNLGLCFRFVLSPCPVGLRSSILNMS
jgi:hydrogenase/urease accessory protein HupE